MSVIRLFAVAPMLVALAACAPSSSISSKSELLSVRPQASLERDHDAGRVAVTEKNTSLATGTHAAKTDLASYGLASFYEEGAQTASGEKFDPHEYTAAHPTLPFGTRLRVTNVATGRSVIVRVNDRGPFVPGRVVDVSYAAAQTLGIVERGTTKVKVDVVQ